MTECGIWSHAFPLSAAINYDGKIFLSHQRNAAEGRRENCVLKLLESLGTWLSRALISTIDSAAVEIVLWHAIFSQRKIRLSLCLSSFFSCQQVTVDTLDPKKLTTGSHVNMFFISKTFKTHLSKLPHVCLTFSFQLTQKCRSHKKLSTKFNELNICYFF